MSKCIRIDFNLDHKFPCGYYPKCIGRLLPGVLGIVLRELGFEVEVRHQQSNGVDIKLYLNGDLVLVIEVLNWSISSRLNHKRRRCIIRNLNEYNCNKLFVYTAPLSDLDGFEENGICTIEIGYQILREPCYNFYLEKDQVIRRRIYSESVKSEIKSKILEYLDNEFFAIKNLRFLFT